MVPAHYIRRRGVLLFLLCMAAISFLHYVYLTPSHNVSSRPLAQDDDDGSVGYLDYSLLGRIVERPQGGPAPIHGIDNDGFEVVEEPYVTFKNKDRGKGQGYGTSGEEEAVKPIQFDFGANPWSNAQEQQSRARQSKVRGMIQHAWEGYSRYASPHDELKAVTGKGIDTFHGWGATLVEGLDTLWLAGFRDEYWEARDKFLDMVQEHHWRVVGVEDDKADVRFFEGVVRYLGSLLSIAELEKKEGQEPDSRILDAAIGLADQLLLAFKGVNRALPASRIFPNGTLAANGALSGKVSLAEVGTFQLEFRKLSQLSNNPKYSAVAQENYEYLSSLNPKISGLFPAYFDQKSGAANNYVASFGSLSDSFYEYLLKTFILTGDTKFRDQYVTTVEAMHSHLLSYNRKNRGHYLVLGIYDTATDTLVPKMDHMSCFAPGLLALGARVLGRSKDMAAAQALMETCFLSYKNSETGLGADEIAFLTTEHQRGKEFEMPMPSGFYVIDPEYVLRPGNIKYQEYAWSIVEAIEKNCKTQFGYSALANVMDASEGMTDLMPSHFLAETLKYLYLIFSPPEQVPLDKYLFTTQGHLVRFSQTEQQ
ncbi:Mannosyl-oligosaccharide 1,2-alpha-mannosidase IB [Podila minutissima]|uniref:alpha-1,2-Mannosidase n=1 Tax=Podila minutissima TaxID=64525 RepID=A0A9P5VLW9_9FUNG|nr:Mannosyl-oligosaccharide 1,2-alpha-mannosidase IB [Podila minutissima]